MKALTNNLEISTFLKTRRVELGLSQRALSKLVGCTEGTILRFEAGTFLPNVDLFLKILEKLNCNMNIKTRKP